MKDIISIRIPSICICFTLVTVANSALNLLHSGGTDMYAVSILLIFVWLVLCQLIDAAICRIDFKNGSITASRNPSSFIWPRWFSAASFTGIPLP